MDCLVCGDTGFAFGNVCTCRVGISYARLLELSAPHNDTLSNESFNDEDDYMDPLSYKNSEYLQLLLEKCDWMHFIPEGEGEDRLSSLPWAYVGRNATHYFYIYIEPDESIVLKTYAQGIDIYVAGDDIPVMTEDVRIDRIEGKHLSQIYMGHS